MLNLIIQLVAGAIGGNLAGMGLKDQSLGTVGNSIAGAVGGGLGGQILSMLLTGGTAAAGAAPASMDIGSLVQSILSGGVGGAVLMVIAGVVKKMMAAK